MGTDDAVRSINESFERLAAAARRAGRTAAAHFDGDLQPATWSVLREVLRGGRVQPHAVAVALSMDKSAVSRHLKDLRERDLVEVERDEQDARATWITPTASAVEQAEVVLSARRESLQRHLGTWEPDDLDRFAVLLERFVDPDWLRLS